MGLMKTRRHAFARRDLYRYDELAVFRLQRAKADELERV